MDIAKIRKKFKETGQAVPKPSAEPEEVREAAEAPSPAEIPAARGEQKGSAAQKIEDEERIEEEAGDSVIELLAFVLAKEEYAFRIQEIQEIVRPQRITRIPKTEQPLLGITSLRGKIVPVIDLKRMLSLEEGPGEASGKQKIVILKGSRGPVGAVIDRVVGVIRPPALSIVETPPHLPEREMRFIEGVAIEGGRFISIIRIEEAVNVL